MTGPNSVAKTSLFSAPEIVGVSLKMYFDTAQTAEWCSAVAMLARRHDAITSGTVALFVVPTFTALTTAVGIFADTTVSVGAQDVFWEDHGAYTGEVSAADLHGIGCTLVEIGHAERRGIFGETDEVFGRKLSAAARNSLAPVLCIGEAKPGSVVQAAQQCIRQLERILDGAPGVDSPLILAYEPEWAIGAERAASVEHVAGVSSLLRDWLSMRPGFEDSRVIYGGSAGPGLLVQLGDTVDGLFLGRFAHDPAALERVLDEALLKA